MGKINKKIAQLLDEIDQMEEESRILNMPDPDSIDNLQKEIEEVEKIKNIFAKDFEEISESIEEIRSGVADLDIHLSEEVEDLSSSFTSRNEEIDTILTRFAEEGDITKSSISALGEEMKKLSLSLSNDFAGKIGQLKRGFEEQLTSHKEDTSRFDIIDKNFLKFEKDLKKYASNIYSYGTSFSISINGTLIGTVPGLNLKAGTGVTISSTTDAQGNVTATINSTGSATVYTETPSGLINSSNKVYTTAHTITTIFTFAINGQFIHPAEYSVVGSTITFVSAPPAALSGLGFTVVYS